MVKSKGDNTTITTAGKDSTIDLPCSLTPSPLSPFPSPTTCQSMLLPVVSTLPDGQRVSVSLAGEQHVCHIFNMIQEAAKDGEGYGVDEFPTQNDFVREVVSQNGRLFRVCACSDPSQSLAAFIIMDSKYYRGQSTVADSYIVVRRQERRQGLGHLCMRMVLEVSRRAGYSAIYNDTFTDNVAMRKIIESCGFQKVGYLPVSAKMPDGGLKPSVIYYRDLTDLGASSSAVQSSSSSSSSHQAHVCERCSPNQQETDAHAETENTP